jgi:hypothetical protein
VAHCSLAAVVNLAKLVVVRQDRSHVWNSNIGSMSTYPGWHRIGLASHRLSAESNKDLLKPLVIVLCNRLLRFSSHYTYGFRWPPTPTWRSPFGMGANTRHQKRLTRIGDWGLVRRAVVSTCLADGHHLAEARLKVHIA